jgi:hypothetical protein
MFAKGIALVLFATAVAATLVGLRQHRLELSHDMAVMHRKIDTSRQGLWCLQADLADQMNPVRLKQRIEAAPLALEPLTPMRPRRGATYQLAHQQETDRGSD